MKCFSLPPRLGLGAFLFFIVVAPGFAASSGLWEKKPDGLAFEYFFPKRAPRPGGLLLRAGDRLAICGDSITEQRMYSRIMETYLTVCVPELDVSVRQYGWSGETAPGFLARLTNDCLRFQPTIATTCYGMNDHGYKPYQPAIGEKYRAAMAAIVESFKGAGARVVLGSPGCVGQVPPWGQHDAHTTVATLNLSLCELRNLDVDLAQQEKVGFADVFWPMLTAQHDALTRYGTHYAVAGRDGVHPDWAGQTIMAYAFLTSLGLSGELATFTVDLKNNYVALSPGHELVAATTGEVRIKSTRYPFCAAGGELTRDNNIRSGMTLVPFNRALNHFTLVLRHPAAKSYRVTWGPETHLFSAKELIHGVNLAEHFVVNPFSEAFAQVDAAVAAKQEFETQQIKQQFHGDAGKTDLEATVVRTEAGRAPLVAAIKAAFVPVTHTIRIEPQ